MISIKEIKEVINEELAKELGIEKSSLDLEKNNDSMIKYFEDKAKLGYYPDDENEFTEHSIFYDKFIKKVDINPFIFENAEVLLASLCASLMSEKLAKIGVVVPSIELTGETKESIVKEVLFPILDMKESQYFKNLDHTFTGEKDDLALSYGLVNIAENKVVPKFIDVSGELKNLESLTKFVYWGKDAKTHIVRCLTDTNIAQLAQSNKELEALGCDTNIKIMINQFKNDGKLWIMRDSEEPLKCDYNVLKIKLDAHTYFEKEKLEEFGKALYFETLTTPIDKLENIRDYLKKKDIKHIDNAICVYAGLKVLINTLDKMYSEFDLSDYDRLMENDMKLFEFEILQYVDSNSI